MTAYRIISLDVSSSGLCITCHRIVSSHLRRPQQPKDDDVRMTMRARTAETYIVPRRTKSCGTTWHSSARMMLPKKRARRRGAAEQARRDDDAPSCLLFVEYTTLRCSTVQYSTVHDDAPAALARAAAAAARDDVVAAVPVVFEEACHIRIRPLNHYESNGRTIRPARRRRRRARCWDERTRRRIIKWRNVISDNVLECNAMQCNVINAMHCDVM